MVPSAVRTPEEPLASAPRRLLDDGAHATPVDLLDAAHAALLERALSAERPAHALMRRAGSAVARLARALAPHARRVIVLAGPGNNGGDGFEAAACLKAQWPAVDLSLVWLGHAHTQPADARASRGRAEAAGVDIHGPFSPAAPQNVRDGRNGQIGTIGQPDAPKPGADLDAWCITLTRAQADTLVIDALLGRGLNRPVDGEMARLIDALNAGAARVLAVDLPSGLNGDTGIWPDTPRPAIVRADATLALLSPAPGLCTGHGRDHVGEPWWHDLDARLDSRSTGIPAQARLVRAATLAELRQPRPHRQHKGSVGDVWVIGGTPTMQGAACLAARAALEAGAGRVHVELLGAVDEVSGLIQAQAPGHDGAQPELMMGRRAEEVDLRLATVVAGCGGGAAMAGRLPEVLAHAARLVLDADALNAIARDPGLLAVLRQRADRGLASVVTPHPLEAARLLDSSVAAVQADRLGAARALTARLGCTALLKGSGSIVCGPRAAALPSINSSGNAALATPGSGDVLAGLIGALWSRLASSDWTAADPGDDVATAATRMAVYLHGWVAQSLSPHGAALPASRLAAALGDWLRRA